MKPALLLVLLSAIGAITAHAQPPIAPPLLPPAPPAVEKPLTEAEKAAEKQVWDQFGIERQQERKAHAGSRQVEAGTGFYWLLRAAESSSDNPQPLPILERNLTAQQQLDYDREFAAHYADSLKLLRLALAKPIVRPLVEGRPFATGPFASFNYNAGFRQLARALDSESNVRLADGDAAGALDSHLDCLAMGVATSDDNFQNFLGSGAPGEGIGHLHIDPILPHLDAKTCRAAAARLAVIEAKRPTFTSLIRGDADDHYWEISRALSDPESRRALETPEGRAKMGGDEGDGPTEAQARDFLALTPETLRQNIDHFYGAVVENAARPFQSSKTFVAPVDVDFQTGYAAGVVEKPGLRFIYERGVVQNRLFGAALQLRAIKLESGVYPATFDAGIDPFSFPLQSLRYRSDGKTYTLYSVGPDGIDNHGAAIQSIQVNATNGIKSLSNRLGVDALGDISAPIGQTP